MKTMSIQLPKSGKARNLASLSPLMTKGGKFESQKPKATHRRGRKLAKLDLRKKSWL